MTGVKVSGPTEVRRASAQPVLVLTQEQQALAESVRRTLERRWEVRRLLSDPSPTPAERAGLWRRLNADIGLAGLTVPVELGGSGGTIVELAVVAEELGRQLCPVPLLAVAGTALPALTSAELTPAGSALLARVLDGEVVTVADPSPDLRVEVASAAGAPRMTGVIPAVPEAEEADALLVRSVVAGADVLLAVDLGRPGVTRSALATLDRARGLATVTLTDAVSHIVGRADTTERADLVKQVVLAADAVGVGARALDIAVDHAKTRVAFGRPIGAFQAIKHRCARMLMTVELARSMVRHAAWALAAEPIDQLDAATAAHEALWIAVDAATEVTADLVRVLGGIGFTWEHEAHLYFRRARGDAVLLGDQMTRRELLTERLLG